MSNLLVQNIKHTNATTAQTIDSTGRILTPARPAFRARIAGSTGATGTQGVLVFETEDFDIGGNYNTSNGIFTAPVTGIYHLMFRAISATDSSGTASGNTDTIFGDLQKNGSNVAGSRFYSYYASAGSHHATLRLNTLIQLSATDTAKINIASEFVYSDTNAEQDPTFEGYLLG